MKRCGTCVHYHMEWDGGGDEDCAYGECTYPVPIPYAWRWAPREKVMTSPSEEHECRYHCVRSEHLPQVVSPAS